MLKRLALVAAILGALGIAATIALWSIPAEDFIIAPGSAKPLEDRVEVEGARPVDDGAVYYTDVSVRRTTLLERLLPFVRPDGSTVLPEHALLPPGTSEAARDRQVAEEMDRSKEIAALVALRSLDYEVEATAEGVLVTGVFPDTPASGRLREGDVVVAADGRRVRTLTELRAAVGAYEPRKRIVLSVRRRDSTQRIRLGTIQDPRMPSRGFIGIRVDQAAEIELPIDVEIDLGRVGGPSAGLPFALEIVRQLGRKITGGCVIAATGALTFDGTVVSVGGIPQKAIAARSAGVDAFLVPIGPNAAEARSHANGLRVIAVASFQQALRKLATANLKC